MLEILNKLETMEDTLNITVNSEKVENNQIVAHVTVDAKDVDNAIKNAYKNIANKYAFQGFRKGKTPRPVIDGIVGREAVMAEATNDLLGAVEPLMVEELDIVPVDEIKYGEEEPELVADHTDYVFDATITVRPEAELDNYDAPEITMPPAEVTDAEVEEQIEQLMELSNSYENVEEDRAVEANDICEVEITNIEDAENFEGTRTVSLELDTTPEGLKNALVGMKKGDKKEVEFEYQVSEDETKTAKANVELLNIKTLVKPELTDEFAKDRFGFEGIKEFKEAIKEQIESDKKLRLPNLKEERIVAAMADRLQLEETPKEYVEQVYREIAQDFMGQLQQRGMSLDNFLMMQGITIDQFLTDLRTQAEEHARQGLALDALAVKNKIEATEEDVMKELESAQFPDVKAAFKQFKEAGQLPAIRESIKRAKALEWLTDNAKVTEVDEVAERRANKDAE